MKLRFFLPLATFLLLVCTVAPAVAQQSGYYGLDDTAETSGYQEKGKQPADIYSIINTGIQVFLSLLAILFFGLSIYAGIRWMTARGNDELVTKGKDTLEAAIIGLIIIMLSYALVRFVFERLGL